MNTEIFVTRRAFLRVSAAVGGATRPSGPWGAQHVSASGPWNTLWNHSLILLV
jgi:hypothetical protein